MFGPPGSLTEASVQQQRQQQQEVDGCGETVASPEAWGLFPRTVLELFRLEGVQSVHASAVEVYHDKVTLPPYVHLCATSSPACLLGSRNFILEP